MLTVIGILKAVARAIGTLWHRGCVGKVIVAFLALLVIGIIGAPFAGRAPAQPTAVPAVAAVATNVAEPTSPPTSTPTAQPTTEVLAQLAADASAPIGAGPSEAPVTSKLANTLVAVSQPTNAPTAAPVGPTATPEPITTIAMGIDPVNGECPAAYRIKASRNKVAQDVTSATYSKTKPIRCFATMHDANNHGYRATAG